MEEGGNLWAERELIIGRSDESLKQFFPMYWSKIQKHYEFSAPRKCISKLSPLDLHHKWESGSYRDRELRSAIANVSPSVVSVSFFTGVQRHIDCSGIIIDWDASRGEATILTSAILMKPPVDRDDYYIAVRLASGEILLAEEHYVDYYHNIVIFKANSDVQLESANLDFDSSLASLEGVEVFSLSREFHTCKLSESKGLVRMDYPYFGCEKLISSTCSASKVAEGGPLITKAGHVCGINFFDGHHYVHPLPISEIRSCLKKWYKYGIVMRPWFGLSVIDIDELPHDALTLELCGDELPHDALTPELCGGSSLLVKEVYEGSPADKAGVSPQDLVTSLACVHEFHVSCASEYTKELDKASDKLTGYYDKTLDIMLCVQGNGCRKVVHAENLRVDDKRFCCSWLGKDSDWDFMPPLIGSQTAPAYDIGSNTDISLAPLGSVSYDTGADNDLPVCCEL